jgi:S1-C subfamily serine protease
MTLRVRNTSCVGLGIGSAISIGEGVVVTNRHVVEGADRLEITTWDGRDLDANVASSTYLNDVALIQTDAYTLPRPLPRRTRVKPRTYLQAVGYPEGGQLTVSAGRALDYVSGSEYGEVGAILRAQVHVEPGNSGGPVLDVQGRLVGIVFAVETSTGATLIVPTERLGSLADSPSFDSVSGTCT